jgi:hypothetical protein
VNRFLRVLFLFSACAILSGSNLSSTQVGRSAVVIAAHPSVGQLQFGDDVSIQSTSTDATRVVRVQPFVNGNLVRFDTPPGSQSQTQFNVRLTWKPTLSGAHSPCARYQCEWRRQYPRLRRTSAPFRLRCRGFGEGRHKF